MNEAQREWAPRLTAKDVVTGSLDPRPSAPTTQQTNVENLIQSINNWHDDLEAAIKDLEARIQPCLLPPLERNQVEQTKQVQPIMSLVSERLTTIQYRLLFATRKLQDLKDRVDL